MAADYHARPSYALSSGNSFPPDLLNRELADIWHKAPMHARHLPAPAQGNAGRG